MSDGNINNFTLERAETALLSRDFALAARLYKSVLKDDENNKEVLIKLGTCYVRANQDEKALGPYLKVLSLDKNNFDALNNLGGIYRRLGRYEESVKVLEAALKLGINTGEVNYNLGHTYKLMGHYDAAAESFYSVIDENPNDVLAYNHLGSIQAARGEYKKALQTYWRGLQIDPNHPILHFNSAISFTSLEKYEDAINSYENALRTKPGWIEALEGYSALLVQQGNFQKAEEVLNTAIQVTPNNEKLRVQKGNLFFKKRCLAEAEEEYKKAYVLNDCNYDTLNGLTKIYENLERYPEASEMLKQLERISKDKKDIIRRQISLLLYQNKLKEAAFLLKNERKKEPENVQILNLLAQFFIRSRETKKELGCYRLIKDLDPNYITYLRDCGEQHCKIGNFQQAQNLTKKYLELNPSDTKALLILGNIAEKKADYDAALKAYQAILKIEPENSLILAAISKIGQETGPNSNSMNIIADILNDSTDSASSNLINESVKAYEESVKNLESTPVELESEMEPLFLDTDFSLEIDDVSDVELDDLFTYDMNECLDFSEFKDDILQLEEVDEESKKTDAYEKLVAEDLPIDYAPTERENGYYNPFEGVNDGDYEVLEDSSVVDVEGNGFFAEDNIDIDLEEPIKETPKEVNLEDFASTSKELQSQNPVIIPVMSSIPVPVVEEKIVSQKPVEEHIVPKEPVAESSDLTFDEDPIIEDDSPYEEELSYEELPSEKELEEAENQLENELESEADKISEEVFEETESVVENELETEIGETVEETEESPLCEIAKMFEDLRNLCAWLPLDIQEDFSNSIDKLRLDYLIEKLSGKGGLLKNLVEKSSDSGVLGRAEDSSIQKDVLCKTMEYLQSLVAFLPNQQQAAILSRETGKVLERL